MTRFGVKWTHDLAAALSTLTRQPMDPRTILEAEEAMHECGIPSNPVRAYLRDVKFPLRRGEWAAWLAHPWRVEFGEELGDWLALAPRIVLVVERGPDGGLKLHQGKDPYWWRDGPHSSLYGRGETDGVPDDVDPATVRAGVWVEDDEMRWARFLSALM